MSFQKGLSDVWLVNGWVPDVGLRLVLFTYFVSFGSFNPAGLLRKQTPVFHRYHAKNKHGFNLIIYICLKKQNDYYCKSYSNLLIKTYHV